MQKDKRCSIWHLIAGLIMVVLGILIWAHPTISLLGMAFYLGLMLFMLGCGYVTFSLTEYSGWYMVIGLFDVFTQLECRNFADIFRVVDSGFGRYADCRQF